MVASRYLYLMLRQGCGTAYFPKTTMSPRATSYCQAFRRKRSEFYRLVQRLAHASVGWSNEEIGSFVFPLIRLSEAPQRNLESRLYLETSQQPNQVWQTRN